jgi:hypothetical protein
MMQSLQPEIQYISGRGLQHPLELCESDQEPGALEGIQLGRGPKLKTSAKTSNPAALSSFCTYIA